MSHPPISSPVSESDVAIIGMSGRFPGASNVTSFWHNLLHGVESIRWFEDDELRAAGVDARSLTAPTYVKARAMLDDVEMFDAEFFGFTPRQASLLDPQHRLFLESVWEGLEHAGYDVSNTTAPVGVFAGSSFNPQLFDLYARAGKSASRLQAMIHNDRDFMTTRVSHKLNLVGPSLCVQTACSTSLVAVHLACQSLLAGECYMAVAGGVSVRQMTPTGYWYQEGGIGSPDGHCRAFDKRAAGTVGGDGAGVVVLKLLAGAIEDGDCIHAVIKASAVNNDGSRKVAYSAPSVTGQANVIAAALTTAGVQPESIGYVEAHGTGTPLGDPIEVAALASVYGSGESRKTTCTLGAVKTNIGHLDAAAGVAGLIKTALIVRDGLVPPTLHYQEPNPELRLERTPFEVTNELRTWNGSGSPRRAAVSSFGMGGTNCHVVVEEPPLLPPRPAASRYHLVPISARTQPALEAATGNLATYLAGTAEQLADVAYTLQIGRQNFRHRRFVVARTCEEAARALASSPATGDCAAGAAPIALMFPGQGLINVQEVRALASEQPVFREALRECCDSLARYGREDLRTMLLLKSGGANDHLFEQTEWQQPALLAIEYALASWWMAWGIRPAAVLGHSLGEVIAACVAGIFSLEDAARLICARGSLMQLMPEGRMLAVDLPEAGVVEHLSENVQLAAVNGPHQSVLSGTPEAIHALKEMYEGSSVHCALLKTSRAFHSSMVRCAEAPLREVLRTVRFHPPRIPCVSACTGRVMADEEATDSAYWIAQLRSPVVFSRQLQTCIEAGARLFVEAGLGATLSRLVRSHGFGPEVAAIPSPGASTHASGGAMLDALGKAWLGGAAIEWNQQARGARRVPLPTYPFERRRYRWNLSDEPAEAPSEKSLPESSRAGMRSHATSVLSPSQEWFFSQAFEYPLHWNQSVLIESTNRVDPEAIQRGFAAVVDHHDSLRLRFRREAGRWLPSIAPPGETLACSGYDMRSLAASQEEAAVLSLGRILHSGLDLERGPLTKLVYLQRSADRPDLVAIIAHHLTCDLLSWQFILTDLETAYLQALNNQPIRLPARTSGFLDWTSALHTFSESAEDSAPLKYWDNGSAATGVALPRDCASGINTVDSVRRQQIRVDATTTRQLCERVCPELGVSIGQVVLAAAAVSLGQWARSRSITMDIEGSGRESFEGCVDISRTTGWFTAIYPLTIPVDSGIDIRTTVAAVRDTLQNVPLGGLGYGMRRYMTRGHADASPTGAGEAAEVVFGHRSIRTGSQPGGAFRRSPLRLGSDQAGSNRRPCLLEIASVLQDETLTVTLLYSSSVHSDSSIGAVLSVLNDRLHSLIRN